LKALDGGVKFAVWNGTSPPPFGEGKQGVPSGGDVEQPGYEWPALVGRKGGKARKSPIRCKKRSSKLI